MQLSEVQGYVLQWREEMVGISQRLMEVEENMRERVSYRGQLVLTLYRHTV